MILRFILITVTLYLGWTPMTAAKVKEKYVLFSLQGSRVKSRIILPSTQKFDKTQPNFLEKIEGNPLIKVWIEKEIKSGSTKLPSKKLPPSSKLNK